MTFTYKDAHNYLNTLLVFGIKLGLKNMEVLCELLGSPQNDLKFIHVAGTNGKGSTCSMLAAACKNAGLKTGFYSSPFLCNFTERWRVDGTEVTEEQVASAIEKIVKVEEKLIERTTVKPTYFEVLTAAALLIFKEQESDVVIWETGMGGRLDATNVVMPILSVITNIGMDHTQYLGDTLEKIAAEKGGIIKKGIPVIIGELEDSPKKIILEIAKNQDAPVLQCKLDDLVDLGVTVEGKRHLRYKSPQQIHEAFFSMVGKYQLKNIGLALRALEFISAEFHIDFEDFVDGASRAIWPGRFDVRKNLILDGAHNDHAIKVLTESLEEIYPDQKFNFVCGILADKEWQLLLEQLVPIANNFYLVEIDNVRTSKPELLEEYLLSKDAKVIGLGKSKDALASIDKDTKTVVLGSLYLLGEVLSLVNGNKALKIDKL